MKIFPRNDLYGEFVVPTDRSITNRAIMLGAIAKGKTRIVNPFVCEDTQTLLSCVKKAGAKVWVKKNCIEIKSPKKLKLSQKFDCGDSVTAMRFLCGAAAGYDGKNAWRIFRRDRKRHKSPNSAHTEAACAGALQLQLAGPNYYFGQLVDKPTIGDDQRPVEALDILRAGRILYATAFFALLLFCGVPLLILLFP